MDYSPWGSKNRIDSKKIMQVEVNVKCMQANFGGHGLSGLGIWLPFKFGQISLMDLVLHSQTLPLESLATISLLDHGLYMGVKK